MVQMLVENLGSWTESTTVILVEVRMLCRAEAGTQQDYLGTPGSS